MWPRSAGVYRHVVKTPLALSLFYGMELDMANQQLTAEDEVLDYTQQKRVELVHALRIKDEKGESIPPQDPKHIAAYLATLDGMDRAALSKKRIQADTDIGNTQAQSAAMIAELLRDPRAARMGIGQRSDVPALDADIAPTRILEGELVTGTQTDSYDSFMTRQGTPQ